MFDWLERRIDPFAPFAEGEMPPASVARFTWHYLRPVRYLSLPPDRLVRRPPGGLGARAALCRARHAALARRGADPDRAADPQHLERHRHEPDPGAADHQHGPLAHAS